MSRSSDGYFGRGSRRRTNQGYSSYRQYGDSYVNARSSQDYRSGGIRSQGRGLMVNPWEGGVVPGSGGVAGRALQGSDATPEIVASINQLSRMDNPESELALNILSAVLTNKEESQWDRQRDWEGGHKRKMDWDDQYYGSGRGILPTPQVPPRKLQKRNAAKFSWGVVGPFVPGWPGRGRGTASGSGYKFKKAAPAKKKTEAAGKTAGKTFKAKGQAKTNPAVKTPKQGENKIKTAAKTDGEIKAKETAKEASVEEKAEDVAAKTDDKEGSEERKASVEGETPDTKISAGETDQKKKEQEPKKRKEECPVPLSYLRCHICHMHKFNNGSNFMDHVRSKKHRRMSLYYKEKIDSTLKMLKAQSWLKSQRHIVSMVKQKGRITKCETCDCPIKGGQGPHLYLREHALVYHFTKCFICKKKFGSRAELEAHKLTFSHMKAQCNQDNIARDRFIRKTKKPGKETIPEQKLTEEFHEMVTQMQLNNLSSQVWNKETIPVYDPSLPIGLNHLVKQSLFVCSVCPKKVSQTAHEALEHSKTKEHYNYYLAHLKAMEEKEEKGEISDKEGEKVDSTLKKEETEKLEVEKTEENTDNKKDDADKPKIKEEKREEIEKEMEATEKEDEEMEKDEEMKKEDEEMEKDDGEMEKEEEEEMEKEEEEIKEKVEKEEEGIEKEAENDKEKENDEEEQEEEDGMKDMENMEVIDEEGEQEEEEVEEENVSKDTQEEKETEGEDGDPLLSVEEVGEDLEEDIALEDEKEEMVNPVDKIITPPATVTHENNTGASNRDMQADTPPAVVVVGGDEDNPFDYDKLAPVDLGDEFEGFVLVDHAPE